jgi:small nuclear ribonucleoprotein (snRNP)-like protein
VEEQERKMSHLNQSQLLISRGLSDAGNGTLHGLEQLVNAFLSGVEETGCGENARATQKRSRSYAR